KDEELHREHDLKHERWLPGWRLIETLPVRRFDRWARGRSQVWARSRATPLGFAVSSVRARRDRRGRRRTPAAGCGRCLAKGLAVVAGDQVAGDVANLPVRFV